MRVLARAGFVAASSALMVGALALPALAEQKCGQEMWGPFPYDESYKMCQDEAEDHTMQGAMLYKNHTPYTQRITGVLFMQKCKAGGVDCVTQAAHSIDVTLGSIRSIYIMTAPRAGVYGYTYRTCSSIESTSGYSWVYSCSPTNSYSP